jgi:hypothetical protein
LSGESSLYACKIKKKKQMAACVALAAKLRKRSKSSLKGASRGMYQSMSKKELRRMVKTKRKGKPTEEKTLGNRRRLGLLASLQNSHDLSQRFRAHFACASERMIKNVYQK